MATDAPLGSLSPIVELIPNTFRHHAVYEQG